VYPSSDVQRHNRAASSNCCLSHLLWQDQGCTLVGKSQNSMLDTCKCLTCLLCIHSSYDCLKHKVPVHRSPSSCCVPKGYGRLHLEICRAHIRIQVVAALQHKYATQIRLKQHLTYITQKPMCLSCFTSNLVSLQDK